MFTASFNFMGLGMRSDLLKEARLSVTNSSDELIYVKERAKDGIFFSKNTAI